MPRTYAYKYERVQVEGPCMYGHFERYRAVMPGGLGHVRCKRCDKLNGVKNRVQKPGGRAEQKRAIPAGHPRSYSWDLPLTADNDDGSEEFHGSDDHAWYVIKVHTGEELTLEQIGELMGVSRERIRQIEERAMEKVMRHFRRVRSVDEMRSMLRELFVLRAQREKGFRATG